LITSAATRTPTDWSRSPSTWTNAAPTFRFRRGDAGGGGVGGGGGVKQMDDEDVVVPSLDRSVEEWLEKESSYVCENK
jgi:hypothetical protein